MAGRLIHLEAWFFLVVVFGWRYTTRLKQAFTELELGPTNPLPFSGGQIQQQRRVTNDGRVCVSMLMSQPLMFGDIGMPSAHVSRMELFELGIGSVA